MGSMYSGSYQGSYGGSYSWDGGVVATFTHFSTGFDGGFD